MASQKGDCLAGFSTFNSARLNSVQGAGIFLAISREQACRAVVAHADPMSLSRSHWMWKYWDTRLSLVHMSHIYTPFYLDWFQSEIIIGHSKMKEIMNKNIDWMHSLPHCRPTSGISIDLPVAPLSPGSERAYASSSTLLRKSVVCFNQLDKQRTLKSVRPRSLRKKGVTKTSY